MELGIFAKTYRRPDVRATLDAVRALGLGCVQFNLECAGLLSMPGLPGTSGTIAGYLIAGTGVVAILTGFFGFCPMCAMVGRKLPSP